ncbi:MAG TPA: helix-turn-helix transcriptional regulator [Actinophytocola sp.]|uniref:helix-turn-helix domain-containing protein n=1 Tax=Actinophytocola sp. TaxID=1872138 RepID=UPI002DBC614C|nr:helix-turn-helix transcriptional regulator [Actinophytocola sp.]HEU5470838.1 helix-turn-helix transcriptional regulator [Actinophytocola sp.]
MVPTTEAFGPRLRTMRTAKGLSLSEFARRLFYSKGHVSRIETGKQTPSAEFARRCDAELDAAGALTALVPAIAPPGQSDPDQPNESDEVWTMTMAPDGGGSFVPFGRRELLTGSAALLAVPRVVTGFPPYPAGGGTDGGDGRLRHHRQLLDTARGLGQIVPSCTVLPIVVGQAQALRVLARDTTGSDTRAVATLSARTAEYAGWMAQEAGDDATAAWWISQAVRIATEVGDHATATYALVRRASITLYQGDAAATVGLARKAQSAPGTPPRILGLAAQREAQGHALAGDYDACLRAIDRAAGHLRSAGEAEPAGPTIGSSHVTDTVSVVTGWCLHDLGRPGQAASILDRAVAGIPVTAVRARTRFGIRQALAHACAGEVDHACTLATPMIRQARAIGSATILADVRRLATTLRRWNSHPSVRAVEPLLATALYRG